MNHRFSIAGALAGNPSCFVLDEPTAMLDPQSREEVLKVVQYLNKEKGITIIWITHHTEEVTEADQIFLMDQGKIVKSGSPQEIFAQPEFLKSIKLEVPAITELYRIVWFLFIFVLSSLYLSLLEFSVRPEQESRH